MGNVASPPSDSMSPQERAEFGARHPDNFINAIRSIEEFPKTQLPSLEQLLQDNLAVLSRFLGDGSFVRELEPSLYIYEMICQDHSQKGIVAEVPVADYHAGTIRGHEDTRAEHEEHLFQYLNVVGATSSPICAAYRSKPRIDEIVSEITFGAPLLDFTDDYGVRQKVWRVSNRQVCGDLEELFGQISKLYVTDGHHRVASGIRHADRRSDDSNSDGPWNYLLMALFPMDQMRILPFNRCIRDIGDLSAEKMLDSLSNIFIIEECHRDSLNNDGPQNRGEFILLFDNRCYRLNIPADCIPNHPVESLDVSLLQSLVLEPLLNIRDPRSDPRLDYVTGELGLDGLRQRAESGWRLSFACYPPSFEELVAVADAGLRMPPKSTCFDPKARSGIFVRTC